MSQNHLLYPQEASFLASAFPQFKKKIGTNFPVDVLGFDATAQESCFWKIEALDYISGSLTLDIYWYAENASSGSVIWEASVASITPNTDSQGIETKSFGAVSFIQDTHLGTVNKRLHKTSIIIADTNDLNASDILFLKLARDADGTNGTDDMANDANLVLAKLSYL